MLTRIADSVRRKGLWCTVTRGGHYLLNKYWEVEIRQHSSAAAESNRRFDTRCGVETHSLVAVENLGVTSPSLACATRYTAMHEEGFRRATRKLKIDHQRFTFVDYGSGKGKALMLAAMYPYKRIVGVDFSLELCRICERNLKLFSSPGQKSRNFEVTCTDALAYRLPSGPTVAFFYNPFHDEVMKGVVRNITESVRSEPRPVWIVYYNPICAEFFDNTEIFDQVDQARRWKVYQSKIT